MADVATPARFRHIVFAGGRSAPGRVIDYTPRSAPAGLRHMFAALPASGPSSQPSSSQSHDEPQSAEEEQFIRWLLGRAGLDARVYRAESLRRRVPACLRALRTATLVVARRMIERQPELTDVAVGALIIGVTSYFRDPAVFDELTYRVLPTLASAAMSRREPIRIWSVGCSDGDELYSVAILLGEIGLLDRCHLLGTDCRPRAIARARAGLVEPASLRHVPGEWVRRYFEPVDAGGGVRAGLRSSPLSPSHASESKWRVAGRLRAAVQFRTGDACQIREPGYWDLILCRNMAMYLKPDAAGRLWELFEEALNPGGFLVLGKAERPLGARRLSPFAPGIYRRDRG